MLFLAQVSKQDYEHYRSQSSRFWWRDFRQNEKGKFPRLYSEQFHPAQPSGGIKYCLMGKIQNGAIPDLIGRVCYGHYSPFKYSKLINIEIQPQFRGKGYGTTIVETILDEAKRWGSLYLSVFVFDHRERAKNLYNKLGFKKWINFHNGTSMIHFL